MVGVALLVIGLAGIPEDVKTWKGWLESLDGESARWAFVIAGVGIVLVVNVLSRLPRFPVPALPRFTFRGASVKKELRVLFRAVADPAFEAGHELLCRIRDDLMRKGGANETTGILIQHNTIDAERAARSALTNDLLDIARKPSGSRHDHLLRLFGDYYEKYQSIRTWILKGGSLTNFPFETDYWYREWRKLDEKFLDRLRDVAALDGFELLAKKIKQVGWGEGVTRDLPRPSPDTATRSTEPA